MNKNQVIEKYFSRKKWYSRFRYSKIMDFRYHVKKEYLEQLIYVPFDGAAYMYSTWEEFNQCLHRRKERIEINKKKNDVSKMNWV